MLDYSRVIPADNTAGASVSVGHAKNVPHMTRMSWNVAFFTARIKTAVASQSLALYLIGLYAVLVQAVVVVWEATADLHNPVRHALDVKPHLICSLSLRVDRSPTLDSEATGAGKSAHSTRISVQQTLYSRGANGRPKNQEKQTDVRHDISSGLRVSGKVSCLLLCSPSRL